MGTINVAIAVGMASVCLHPTEPVTQDAVDLIEVNHFYDEHGKLVFDQVIFYDWSAATSRYHVRAWRLLKSPGQVPRRNWKRRDFVSLWHDGDMLRQVRATSMRETWTQYDPELMDREHLPKQRRRELGKPVASLSRRP